MLADEDIQKLELCPNEKAWDDACAEIKRKYGGYPADWYSKVIAGGMFKRLEAKWGKPDAFDIKIGGFNP